MFKKYYTCDLITLKGEELEAPSITVGVNYFTSPVQAVCMIREQLAQDGLSSHRVHNLRRIK